jgi:hypothetical protein
MEDIKDIIVELVRAANEDNIELLDLLALDLVAAIAIETLYRRNNDASE